MRKIHIIAVAIWLAGAPAFGQSVAFGDAAQDTDAPVEVTADALSVTEQEGTALFTGNVVIAQGDFRLAAPRVLITYDQDGDRIARMEATGGVTLVSGTDAAEAERADYDPDAGTIVMTGKVLLTQGSNAISAERMSVDLDGGTAEMSGGVRTLIQPGAE
ncbi:lipopolysaccharide transport periplasmic protein LptA [Rhodosalinus sp. FB01]|uniref:lipopolysaccharide transport periplasmic protein LptA n=1 Tax=Rhodosalinus sp. FB01 TaxID=3239194 RepID=UPI00352421CE